MAKSQEDIYKERLNKLKAEKERTLIIVPDVEVSKDKEIIVADQGSKIAAWRGQRLTSQSPEVEQQHKNSNRSNSKSNSKNSSKIR
ncbi:MAG: hypothetical protein K2P31_04180 [Rickettsiaceae bacterium]|nr:hypothetical protein [Rickettsiaceae bacterium]